jgi:hypothetical protein
MGIGQTYILKLYKILLEVLMFCPRPFKVIEK